uniref:Uncharacterized protein n=1 Tax=Arundo donax TaxID=35708 RepID=A0A0A9HF86_ARUDO
MIRKPRIKIKSVRLLRVEIAKPKGTLNSMDKTPRITPEIAAIFGREIARKAHRIARITIQVIQGL